MRTSLNNIRTIDDYLFGRNHPGDALLLEANLVLNPSLADDVLQQQKVYAVIEHYSRKMLRSEIKSVQEKLATAPQYRSFMQRIVDIF